MIDRDASNRTVDIINLGFINPLMKTSTIKDVVVIEVPSIRTMDDSCAWIRTRVVMMR